MAIGASCGPVGPARRGGRRPGAAIRLKPNRYQAHTTLGQVFQAQGRLDDASASFGRAIACHPEPSVLAGLYRTPCLAPCPRRDITPAQQAAALGDLDGGDPPGTGQGPQGQRPRLACPALLRRQQAGEALAACDAALKLVPDDPEAHRVRIAALMELKRYDEVLASANAYLARGKPIGRDLRDPRPGPRGAAGSRRGDRRLQPGPRAHAGPRPAQRSRLLNRRGWAYQYADAPRLALADFEESLRLEPNQSEALGGRGLARIRLGDWRPAVTDAEAAIRQAPRGRRRLDRAKTRRAAKVQALFNAARIYAQAVEFAAQDVSRQGERAVALYRRYRSRALELLDEALEQRARPGTATEILERPRVATAPTPPRPEPTGSPGIASGTAPRT